MKQTRLIDRFIAIAMVAFISWAAGCNYENGSVSSPWDSDVPGDGIAAAPPPSENPLSLDLFSGLVTASGVVLNYEEGTFVVSYSYIADDGTTADRMLMMRGRQDLVSWADMFVTDTGGVMQWSLSVGWDPSDSTRSYLVERTAVDSLWVETRTRGDRLYEHYVYNGDHFSIDFTGAEMDDYQKQQGRPRESIALGKRPLSPANTFNDFYVFYPRESSLNNNVDGQIAIELLFDQGFLDWVADETGLPYLDLSSKEFDPCAAANVASIKCLLGGIMNPICHVAIGVSVACGVITVLEWFGLKD